MHPLAHRLAHPAHLPYTPNPLTPPPPHTPQPHAHLTHSPTPTRHTHTHIHTHTHTHTRTHTLRPQVFGRVIGDGMLVMRKIEAVATGPANRPKLPCVVTECGEM
mgnify:CR=1 FL=1